MLKEPNFPLVQISDSNLVGNLRKLTAIQQAIKNYLGEQGWIRLNILISAVKESGELVD